MRTIVERFWSKVRPEVGDLCWEWAGYRDPSGYGRIGVGGKSERASRVSWQLHFGPILDGQCVLHRCDNPACVRPDHLFLGTKKDNNADRAAKGRGGSAKIAGELNRHAKLTADQVRTIRSEYAAGHSKSALARRFAVTQPCIRYVIDRHTWKHIP